MTNNFKFTLKYIHYIKFATFIALSTTLISLQNSANASEYNNKDKVKTAQSIDPKNKLGLIKKYKDWSSYKIERPGYKTCYSISIPFASSGNKIKRGQPFFNVVNVENDADEVSLSAGFYFKPDTDIEVVLGNKKFFLFAYKNYGWSYSKNDDIDLIKEMQKNDSMLVTYYDKKNNIVTDKYSLIGFKKSYFNLKYSCKS